MCTCSNPTAQRHPPGPHVLALCLAGLLLLPAPRLEARYCAGDRELILVRIEHWMWYVQYGLRELEGAVRTQLVPALLRHAQQTELWSVYLTLRGEVEKAVPGDLARLSPARLAPWLDRAAQARQAFLNVAFQPQTRHLIIPAIVAANVCAVLQRPEPADCAAIAAWDPELAGRCQSPVIDVGGYARLCTPAGRSLLDNLVRWTETSCRAVLGEEALPCELDLFVPLGRFASNCAAFERDDLAACGDPGGDGRLSSECGAPILTRRLLGGRISFEEYAERTRLDPVYLRALEAFVRLRGDCNRVTLDVFDDEAEEFFETWPRWDSRR